MAEIKAFVKLIGFCIHISCYLLTSFVGRLFYRDEQSRRRFHARNVTRFTWLGCHLLRIFPRYINAPAANQSFFFVGNHLGFLDILVLSSLRPVLFITSEEMRKTPFLGLLCEMGGCLFVERRSRSRLPTEIAAIRKTLQDGFSVVLYPEGTSGDGSKVLPFKKSLLVAAADSGVPIQVMVINYRKIDGKKINDETRNHVCWYGDLPFFASLWKILKVSRIEVDLSFHDQILVSSDEERQKLVAQIQGAVEAHFDPIPFLS